MLLVLIVDRHPFDCLVAEYDAEREGGRLDEPSGQSLEEHAHALLRPQFSGRAAYRVETLNLYWDRRTNYILICCSLLLCIAHLQTCTNNVQRIRDYRGGETA